MRILHLISSPASGGAEMYVKDLSIALVKEGHQVFIGFLEHAADSGRSADFEMKFLSELTAAGINYFFVGTECRRRPWLGCWRLFSFVKKHDIDVCHSHMLHFAFFSLFVSVPCAYTHHSIIPKMGRVGYFLLNFIIDQYVGISDVCAKRLSGYTNRKVRVIFNGVNFERFLGLSAPRTEFSHFNALAVGRLTPPKNYFFLIDVVSSLPERVLESITISIAGEGDADYLRQLRAYAEEKGVSEKILFLGNRNDIPRLMASANLFLMSSDWEGLPIALIEASASGLPCVVTDVGGCREVITRCNNGVCVPARDVTAYVNAVTELVDNPALCAQLSSSGIRQSSSFSILNSCNEHILMYSGIL